MDDLFSCGRINRVPNIRSVDTQTGWMLMSHNLCHVAMGLERGKARYSQYIQRRESGVEWSELLEGLKPGECRT